MKLRPITTGALLCAALLLLAAPAAFAQTAAQDAYSAPSGKVEAQLQQAKSGSPDATVHKAGTDDSDAGLPFTGLDLVLVVAAGGGLLAMGFAMRRLTRSDLA